MVAILEKVHIEPARKIDEKNWDVSFQNNLPIRERSKIILPNGSFVGLDILYGEKPARSEDDVRIWTFEGETQIRSSHYMETGEEITSSNSGDDVLRVGPSTMGPIGSMRIGYFPENDRFNEAIVTHANRLSPVMFDCGYVSKLLGSDSPEHLKRMAGNSNLLWTPNIAGFDADGYGYWLLGNRRGISLPTHVPGTLVNYTGGWQETGLIVGRVLNAKDVSDLRTTLGESDVNEFAIAELYNYPSHGESLGRNISAMAGIFNSQMADTYSGDTGAWIYAIEGVQDFTKANVDFVEEKNRWNNYPLNLYESLR